MHALTRFSMSLLLFLTMCVAHAANRPTISFNGQNYYLARAHYETDHTHSPVNVVELYILEGESSDNYSKSIERTTYLQLTDYKASAKARLSEFKEDNKGIPFEEIIENDKTILNVTFWWPFRPSVAYKHVYVFQEDKKANRAMSYMITELQFFDVSKTTNADLVKQGSALLLNNNVVQAATKLSF